MAESDVQSGAGLASFLLVQSLITTLVMHRVLPRDLMVEIIDQALMQAEGMQGSHPELAASAPTARRLIELTRTAIERVPPQP